MECDVTSNDFADTNPKFIQTGRQQDSHVFDVDGSSVVAVGNELIVDVNAVNTPRNDQLDETSNIVEVVSEGGGGDGDETDDTSDGFNGLNFNIDMTRTGFVPPVNGDFVAGQDTIIAALNVTSGEIVETKVRWIVATDNWESGKPNIQDFTGE